MTTATLVLIAGSGLIAFLLIVYFVLSRIARKKRLKSKKAVDTQPETGDGPSRRNGILSSLLGIGKGVGDVVGARSVGVVLWILVLVSFGVLFPEAFAAWWGHQNIFWISQIVAILLILFVPVSVTRLGFALAIFVMLYVGVKSTFAPPHTDEEVVAKINRDDTGWVRDPNERAVEVRRMMVYPNQSKVALIANEYRFDANCEGYAEIIIYGNPNPLPCNPEPGTKHLGDRLRTYNGWLTLEFVAKKPVQVIVRRWPKS